MAEAESGQRKMRFLFISTKGDWGGSEPLWCDAAKRALQDGHGVTVVIPRTGELHARHKELVGLGAELLLRPPRQKPTFVNRVRWKLSGITQPETQWWRDKITQKPDAICVSQGGTYCAMTVPGLIPWLLEGGTPYLLVCHSHRDYALPESAHLEELRHLMHEAKNVCFDAFVHAKSAERLLGQQLGNALAVQNPLNLVECDAVDWPDNDRLRMACIARLEVCDKGQDLLIEALSDPVWKERDFELNLYGDGPDRQLLQNLIARHGLEERVKLAGFVSDVRGIWATHHLLVLPSLSEGTPISLVEAQVCARPSLVTKVDGNPEWVEERRSGLIAETATVPHLKQALERTWENRSRLREMGKAAREDCMAKRDPDPGGSLFALLREAAERRKS
jgi:glycosyltransferase involved in cell wall biosynthesis